MQHSNYLKDPFAEELEKLVFKGVNLRSRDIDGEEIKVFEISIDGEPCIVYQPSRKLFRHIEYAAGATMAGRYFSGVP